MVPALSFSRYLHLFSSCGVGAAALASLQAYPARSLQAIPSVLPRPAQVSPLPRGLPSAPPCPHRAGQIPRLASRSLSQRQKYDYYASLASLHGARPGTREVQVLALRGLDPQGRRHASGDNVGPYNDTFVVLSQGRVSELRGSTHAGQESSTIAPNGVAQIRPGNYHATPAGDYADMACWLLTTSGGDENLPSWRDFDADGFVSEAEKRRAERHAVTADEILLHNGRYADHGSSIGCQVLPPEVYRSLIDLVGKQSTLCFTLIDANLPNPWPR